MSPIPCETTDAPSLRSFLAELPEEDTLRIREPMELDYLPTALILELEKRRLAFDKATESAIPTRDLGNPIVQDEQSTGRNGASGQGRVRPGHRILHGIREQQQKREIEGRHLPDLTLSTETNSNQHQAVDHGRAQHNLQQDVTAREKHSAQFPLPDWVGLAVTGIGAFLGVLR